MPQRLMLILLLSALLPSWPREAKTAPALHTRTSSSRATPSRTVPGRKYQTSPQVKPAIAAGPLLQQIEPEQVPLPVGMWSGLPVPPRAVWYPAPHEVVMLVAHVRVVGEGPRLPVQVNWTVETSGRQVFARTRRLGPAAFLSSLNSVGVRYAVPAPGAYRFTVALASGSPIQERAARFVAVQRTGSRGTTFQLPNRLEVTLLQVSVVECLSQPHGFPPTRARAGNEFLVVDWLVRNGSRHLIPIDHPHFRVIVSGSLHAGDYAGYPGYGSPIQPSAVELLPWAFEIPRGMTHVHPAYVISRATGATTRGADWAVVVPSVPSAQWCTVKGRSA